MSISTFLFKFLVVALCLATSISCATVSSQSEGKKKSQKTAVIAGALNVVDYLDTFKLNPEAQTRMVSNAKLQDSVTITILLDGTRDGRKLKLDPNESFDQLFKDGTLEQSAGWVNPGKEFSKAFIQALDMTKAYHVEIQYKRRKEKFYGVISFNKVYQACAGDPSARSYFIRIPEVYMLNALGGNISVVYEYYECSPRLGNKLVRDYTTKKARYTSWVLWISDISFVE